MRNQQVVPFNKKSLSVALALAALCFIGAMLSLWLALKAPSHAGLIVPRYVQVPQMLVNKSVPVSVPIHNPSSGTVNILAVKVSCGCLDAAVDPVIIHAGADASLNITLKRAVGGAVRENVVVVYRLPHKKELSYAQCEVISEAVAAQ